VFRTPQMAKNGKNRLAILTIFRFRRTDVKIYGVGAIPPWLPHLLALT
jgi:hypothetical protein